MKTTLAEITSYRAKFAQELARISAKQAEAAKKAAAAAANAKSGGLGSGTMSKKLSDGSKAGSSPGGGAGSKITTDGGSSTSKKKKKRKPKKTVKAVVNGIDFRSKGVSDQDRPSTLCISRNKHWKYISSYHVGFLVRYCTLSY